MSEVQPRLATMGQAVVYVVVGDTYTQLASGEDTGGAFALFHAVIPSGHGPPPHTHSREDESFYILDGQVQFHIAQSDGSFREVVANRGDFVFAPRNVAHRFENTTNRSVTMLIQTVPAGIERFFAEVDQSEDGPIAAGPPSLQYIARLVERAAAHGIQIHLPA